ncbi:hypothetical protein [Kitasatospora cineracea]|uniref:Uncharacterized protein n=1 Tax=Kitasatospora cineracea TaxID=88074 RepID=A0A3N4RNN5_9ACTN|nr:hypothetical protein [Kitasatospora cineracea]RPE34963.1 hypothetical protein EDD38_3306 [Kitasatospora cineracea]
MPWVRLDDRFPSHRKVALLTDKAFRLYVSALCWCSENLTEGQILDRELPVITRVRGARTAAAELEKAGLWDRTADGWVVHDYLEYNPDRAKVQAEREAGKARQQAWRDRKKAKKEAARNGERNATRNGVTDCASDDSGDSSTTATRHDGDTNARETDRANQRSSQVNEIRNAPRNAAPSRPQPLVPPTEVQLASRDAAEQLPMIGPQPRIPANCRPLVDALTASQMVVGWDLGANDWLLIEALIVRCGTPMLVDHARGQWQSARQRPRSGSYFIPGWRSLPNVPAANAAPVEAPRGPLTQNQAKRALFDQAAARLAGGM